MHIRQTSHSSGAVGINAPGDGGVGDAAVGAVGALFFIPETVVELIFIRIGATGIPPVIGFFVGELACHWAGLEQMCLILYHIQKRDGFLV